MNIISNLENMTDAEKLAVLESVQKSISESREIQKKKIGENVNLVISALKKIETEIQARYDAIGTTIENRVASIKDGKDGKDGRDGVNGRDGKSGRDGAKGDKGDAGLNGRDGVDGVDGVSVLDAKIDFDGSLIITLSTGQEINVGEVVAPELQEKIKLVTSGGAGTVLPEQAGNSGKVLGTDGSVLSWVAGGGGGGGSGTVTSVTGTGTVSGLTLSGTVTTSGNLTLGGAITGFATSGANTNLTSVALTSGTITATPSSGNDIVNKTYADAIASGIHFHEAVVLATTAALPANTYNNGTSGVGATLTGNANGALSVDSTLTIVAERILVKNEVTGANNGVYVVTQVGSAGTPYILTRATDFDTVGTGVDQIDEGDFFLVTSGTANVNTAWVQQTPPPITIGSTAIVFQQFAAPTSMVYPSGTGIAVVTSGTSWGTTLTAPSGAVVGTTDTQTLTNKRIDPRVVSAASASSLTPSIATADIYAYTALAAGLTINAPTGTPVDGNKLMFRLLDNGTARALTWNATYTVIGVTLPTTTVANKTTYVGCIYNANNTRWDVIAVTTQA